MTPWDRMKQAREALGLSQRELSHRAGMAASVVNKLERGERPTASFETMTAIAKALGVSVQWLMTGELGPSPTQVEESAVEAGFRRFREYVRDREATHASLLPEFLEFRAHGASRYPANVTATDIEEELLLEFRRWRRGRDADGGGEPVRSKTGRAFPGTE